MFNLRADLAEGAVQAPRVLQVPLPEGGSVPHTTDVALEAEGRAALYVDVLDAGAPLADLKAHAFDVVHLKRAKPAPYCVLLFVRQPNGALSQDLAEAVADRYDLVFGVDEVNVGLASKFAALRSELLRRLSAGGR